MVSRVDWVVWASHTCTVWSQEATCALSHTSKHVQVNQSHRHVHVHAVNNSWDREQSFTILFSSRAERADSNLMAVHYSQVDNSLLVVFIRSCLQQLNQITSNSLRTNLHTSSSGWTRFVPRLPSLHCLHSAITPSITQLNQLFVCGADHTWF